MNLKHKFGKDFNSKIEQIISDNKKIYIKALKKYETINDENEKIIFLSKIAQFLSSNNCAILSSSDLEKEIIKISKSHSVLLDKNFEKDSFLHVLSLPYVTGGHTRVVERWIKNSPKNQKHSMLVTNDFQNDPKAYTLLKENIKEKNGEIVVLNPEESLLERALKLRQIASKYEYIILHIHMDDIIPMLAFGTSEFKRPVILFNHADHLFWCGVSISDLVVNLRTFSTKINFKYRQAKNNEILPLPICKKNLNTDNKKEIKELLKIEDTSKVILTIATSYKYVPFGEFDFAQTALEILKKTKDTVFVVIGPSETEKYWKQAIKKSNNRMKVIGMIPNVELEKYISIADMVIDSFPFSSFTALLDVAKYNIPCLSIKTALNDIDTFNDAKIFCENQQELIGKVCNIVNCNAKIPNIMYKILEEKHFEEGFSKELLELYKKFPKNHMIHDFETDNTREPIDLETFVEKSNFVKNNVNNESVLIPKIYNCRSVFEKKKYLSIFNKKILIKRRILF